MYFILKALAHSLILPPGAPLLLATLAAVLIRSRRRFGWTLLILGLASEWLLCMPVVADELTRWVERYPAIDLDRPTDAQAVVILGGGGQRMDAPEYRGPVAESVLLERLTYGAYVARRTGLPVLVSGAPQEAVAMRTTLARNLGIEPKWVDDQSRDTYENAHLSARILRAAGISKVLLVTSSTHEWRATQEFLAVGLQVVPAPVGVLGQRETGPFRFAPGPAALMRSSAAVYELIGEQARRLQSALGVRDRLDKRARLDR